MKAILDHLRVGGVVEITYRDGVYYLSGRLDEFAEFDSLAQATTTPLKLNLGKIASINSVGVRKFLAFTIIWSPRQFAFFECTPEFIANVNVIPQMLGNSGDVRQVQSFYVPYSCEPCKRLENVLIVRDTLRFDAKGEVMPPQRSCAKCGEAMELDVERNEYFTFLTGFQQKAS